MEEQNLVVKTKLNPVKNAVIVDSHIKGPRKSPGEVCKPEGEKCVHDSECYCGNGLQWLYCDTKKGICMNPFELHKIDNVAAGIGKENLVVKTQFNPVKNAIVADSHIKSQKQSQGKGCKPVGQRCDHDDECCDNHICAHYNLSAKKVCRVSGP